MTPDSHAKGVATKQAWYRLKLAEKFPDLAPFTAREVMLMRRAERWGYDKGWCAGMRQLVRGQSA